MSTLALYGGEPEIKKEQEDLFHWPIVTSEDEAAVLGVLRAGGMSSKDITMQFEEDFKSWMGMDYALACNNGTAALQSAMWACGIRRGDEIIGPSITYWASLLPALSLGATPLFCEIKPDTLCIDPNDIEHRIGKRTKAILVVHYCGHPVDMDPILEIARKHNLYVIEDVSHAHGARYKGRLAGTIGDVACMSMMSGKSFAIGEGGMMVTNNRDIYEGCIAWGHYSRYQVDDINNAKLREYAGLPIGGYKYRMHQMSSAVGRVQLRYYDQRMQEIQKAMHYFLDQLEDLPGIKPHRTPADDTENTMGGWYAAKAHYVPEDLEGLSVTRFTEALRAEGLTNSRPGMNKPLHLHPLFQTCDIYGDGKPTRIAFTERDVRESSGSLPVSEGLGERVMSIPWFKHNRVSEIDRYAAAYKKVVDNYKELLKDDPGNGDSVGGWNLSQI